MQKRKILQATNLYTRLLAAAMRRAGVTFAVFHPRELAQPCGLAAYRQRDGSVAVIAARLKPRKRLR